MTSPSGQLRAAAAALGADPDEVDELANSGSTLSRREAERALGGQAAPITRSRPNPFAVGAMPPRPRQGQRRVSRSAAAQQLGELTVRQRMNRAFIAREWRSGMLARFQTRAGRCWLVKLLETQLTGTETEVPPGITEAIDHALQADRSRPADCPTLASVSHARDTYRAIVRELRGKGKLP